MIKVAIEMISDDFLIDRINQYANEAGIPVTVEKGTIKVGGGLFAKPEPCIVVYNSKFRSKYYNYDIVQRQQGNYVFISIYYAGISENYKRKVFSENSKSPLYAALIKPNGAKHEAEHAYYDIVESVINDAIVSSEKLIKPNR